MADDRSGAPSPEGSLGGTAADGDAQDTPVSSPAGDTGSVEPGKPAKGAKAAKAAKGAGKSASAKSAKGKRPASAAGAGAGAAGGHLILAEHPRAVSGIARAKAWGGLGGFLLGGYLSLPTHTLPEAGLRALAAGVVCYLAAWAAAVFLWQRLRGRRAARRPAGAARYRARQVESNIRRRRSRPTAGTPTGGRIKVSL